MHVKPHDSIEELQRRRRLKRHRDIAGRLEVVILARQGQTAPQIAAGTGMSRRPVQEWVRRYNAQGLAGLYDRPRSGQPTKLPREQEEAFKQCMLAGPVPQRDGGRCTLRGLDAQRILEQEFAASYSLGGAIGLWHRLGLSCLRPRPKHRKNEAQAMTDWVGRAPLLSRASRSSIPTSRSKSGSRTKRASASRER